MKPYKIPKTRILKKVKRKKLNNNLELYNAYKVSVRLVRESNLQYLKPVEIRQPLDAYIFIKNDLEDLDREMMVSILLDITCRVIGVEEVAIGMAEHCETSPKEIFKSALLCSANAVLLAHNHPSGSCKPSSHDLSFNETVEKAGSLMGIKVIDHIIIGKGKFYSITQKCSCF